MIPREPTLVVHPHEVVRKEQLYTQPPLRHGFWRALVVDNKDPEGLGRVRVWIPQLHGNTIKVKIKEKPLEEKELNQYPWAWPVFREKPPKIGQGVWVAFELGDPDHPVYFGRTTVLDPERGSHDYVPASTTEPLRMETPTEYQLCTTPKEARITQNEKETDIGAPNDIKIIAPGIQKVGVPLRRLPKEIQKQEEPDKDSLRTRQARDWLPTGTEIPRLPQVEVKQSYTKETGVHDKGAGTPPDYSPVAQPEDYSPNIFGDYVKTLPTEDVKLLKWQNIIRKEWSKICAGQDEGGEACFMLNRHTIEVQRLNVWSLTKLLLEPLLTHRVAKVIQWNAMYKYNEKLFIEYDKKFTELESEFLKETDPNRKAELQRQVDELWKKRNEYKEEAKRNLTLYNIYKILKDYSYTEILTRLQIACSYDESILQHIIYPFHLVDAFSIIEEYISENDITIHTLYTRPEIFELFAQSALRRFKKNHPEAKVGFRELSNIRCIISILLRYYISVFGLIYNNEKALVYLSKDLSFSPEGNKDIFLQVYRNIKERWKKMNWEKPSTLLDIFGFTREMLLTLAKGPLTINHYNILTFLFYSFRAHMDFVLSRRIGELKHPLAPFLLPTAEFPKFSDFKLELPYFRDIMKKFGKERETEGPWWSINTNWPNEYKKLSSGETTPERTFLLRVVDAIYQSAVLEATKLKLTGEKKDEFINRYNLNAPFWDGRYLNDTDKMEEVIPQPDKALTDGPIFLPTPGPHSVNVRVVSEPVVEQMKKEIIALEEGKAPAKELPAKQLETEAPIGDRRDIMYNDGFFRDGNSIGIQHPTTGGCIKFDDKGNCIINAKDVLIKAGKHIYTREGEKIPKGVPIDCDRFLYLDP